MRFLVLPSLFLLYVVYNVLLFKTRIYADLVKFDIVDFNHRLHKFCTLQFVLSVLIKPFQGLRDVGRAHKR